MGKDITDKDTQVTFLKQRLNMFMELLEAIEPEDADVDDIDRLLEIIDEIESKVREFNNRDI
ncbi:SE1561 family protein [Neobacillus sp. YIM B06451]|uniref:SE1561 family protein n=1 Tax=Neobacillus TaxID=2675232 RepID=UPI00292E7795|nr:SE1561 family protein [Neobacillus sp. YIM B06451]